MGVAAAARAASSKASRRAAASALAGGEPHRRQDALAGPAERRVEQASRRRRRPCRARATARAARCVWVKRPATNGCSDAGRPSAVTSQPIISAPAASSKRSAVARHAAAVGDRLERQPLEAAAGGGDDRAATASPSRRRCDRSASRRASSPARARRSPSVELDRQRRRRRRCRPADGRARCGRRRLPDGARAGRAAARRGGRGRSCARRAAGSRARASRARPSASGRRSGAGGAARELAQQLAHVAKAARARQPFERRRLEAVAPVPSAPPRSGLPGPAASREGAQRARHVVAVRDQDDVVDAGRLEQRDRQRRVLARVARLALDPADRPAELVGGDLGGDLRLRGRACLGPARCRR